MDLTERISKLSPEQGKLLALKLGQQNINIDMLKLPITRENQANDRQRFPLSLQQERLWFIHQLAPDTTAYNIVNPTKLEGILDKHALEQSIDEMIQRHDILRTIFISDKQAPAQVILDQLPVPLEIIDLTGSSTEKQEREIKETIRDESLYVFDLAVGPLLKTKLLVLSENVHIFLLVIHHMICDGTSIRIFIRELVQIYEAISERKPPHLPELSIGYVDYACWQRQWFGLLKHQEKFWLEQFKGEIPVLNLPLDYPRPVTQDFEGSTSLFHLSAKETKELKEMALKENTTLYVVLLTLYYIFLSKVSGMEDIVVGTPAAGRRHPDVQKLIGMFVNTLALRNYPHQNKTYPDLLAEVKNRTLKALENQEYQYEDLLGQVQVTRDISRNPLFDVMFLLGNVDVDPGEIKTRGLTLNIYDYENKTSKFDLTLRAWEQGDILYFSFEYCTKLFKETTIRRMIGYFKKIVTSAIENPAMKIKEIEIISPQKKREILSQFNRDLEDTFDVDTIQHKLSRGFRENPDHVAIEYGAVQVSYSQLEKKSTCISRRIQHHELEKGCFIGIYQDDQIEIISLIIGILNAGCVFVPLDTALPVKRVQQMAQLVCPLVIFTTAAHKEQLINDWQDRAENIEFIEMDASFYKQSLLLPPLEQEIEYKGDDDIYIYFTSGTTGVPRAILGKNTSLLHFINWEIDTFGITSAIRVSQLAAVGFDAFLRNVFTPLCAGGVVCIPESRDVVLDSEAFIHWIDQGRIQLIHCVPAVFRLFNWETVTPGHFKNLKYVLIAGDIIYPHELERWYRKFDNRVGLVNCYGTTETTMFKTYYHIQKTDSQRERIPLGRCIRGASVIILDENKNVCDQGIVGEIYIRTPYRTRGYYNAPQLNEETFIPNPFKDDPCDLVARTGDLGRWLEDGNIEFLGRKDARVKIRGVRIELEEIENQLLNHKEIKECVVVVRSEDGAAAPGNYEENYLCAYIVSARKLSKPGLREYLKQYLPGYMIPAYFVFLDRMPLTPNLKIDRTALPDPGPEPADNYTAPRTAAEKRMVEIWSDVLKTGKHVIGINSNFFELGGHSLKAANMAAKVHKEFQVKLPLAEIFRSPTIKGLSRYIRRAVENKYTPIKTIEKKEYYSLSSAQKRLYILHQVDVKSTAYNMPQVIPLVESPGIEKLEKAFTKLIHRHESLRTSFAMIHDQPVQKTHQPDEIQFAVQYYDMREVEVKVKAKAEEIEGTRGLAPLPKESNPSSVLCPLSSEFIRSFDLSRAPLIRVGLIKIEPLKHILMIDMHHIISDAISLRLMKEDFIAFYENRKLNKLRIGYKDYAEWQNSSQQTKAIKKQEEYWLKEFNDVPTILNLPFDYPRPELQSFSGDRVYFEIGKEQQEALEKTAKSQDATLFMLLLAAYNVLLAKLTGQEDIIIGTPTAGRQHPDLEHIIGMFVNTLALRNYPAAYQPFYCFLEETKQRTLKAFDHQDYQFEDLVEKISLKRDIGRNPLFDVMFSLHNLEDNPGDTAGIEAAANYDSYRKRSEISKFDMTFIGVHSSDKLTFIVEYCTKLFKKETIDRFIGYFNRILSRISRCPDILLSQIDIISEEEKHQLLYDFNDTGGWFPENKTLHQLFEEQVEQRPDNIIVVGPLQMKYRSHMTYMTHISYRELNENSNQLAHLLIEKGVQPDTIAGIIAEPSVETIVGIIGILKAGGAYLPIDPDYPEERKQYMLADSGAKVLVTAPGLPGEFEKLLIVNRQLLIVNEMPPNCRRLNNPPKEANSINNYQLTINNLQLEQTNLAYVIYTSGSTGNPKGVMVRHGNITNQIFGLQKMYPFDDSLHHILMAPFTFDPSVQQIFLPLTTGGRLLLVSNPVKNDAVKLLDMIVSHRLNIFNTVPSFMNVLLDHIDGDNSRRFYFKYIILAGEVFSKEVYIKLREKFFIEKLINIYGPTEATINTTWYECLPREKNDTIPIGKPLMNYKVLILDDRQELVPTGVVGEICISGQGLAPGYLNQPELTAEKFIPVYRSYRSYRSYISRRLYKTGDLGRWTAKGIIQFLGRIDEQVKIRGIRVELGEIESQILKHHKVKEAVVLAKEDGTGDKYLTAYIVSDKQGLDAELKNYLSHFIPGYMIPSYFVQLERIPLTPNGKINRKALPEPQNRQTSENYIAPRDEIERKLVEIWSEVLGRDASHASQLRESISIDDNFFELGGHSLKAIILTAKIHKNMNVKISLAEFFNAPFIRKLAARVSITPENRCKAIAPVEKKEFYALSSAQMRLYILQQMDLNSTAYNIPQVVVLEGSIDKMRLHDTLNRLIHRHESLRTSFIIVDEESVQKIHEEVEFEMENYQVEVKDNEGTGGLAPLVIPTTRNPQPATAHISSFIRPFDLSCAPLLRTGMIQGNSGDKYILMVDMHHIISDEVSHDIFIKDLLTLYGGNELPKLRLQYKDFSQWQNNQIKSGTIKKQQEYWLKIFAEEIPLLNMPTDYERPDVLLFEGHTIAFEIGSTLYTGIKTLVSESKTTLNILLLAAYNVLLSKYTGQETILVGNVIAGRRHADLHNIIGFFVNMLAMKNHLEGEQTFEEFLGEVKETSVKAYENQDYQFEELVSQLKLEREAGRHPLIDTVFVLQDPEDNQADIQAMKESGLKANWEKIEHKISHFDLMLHVTNMSHWLSIIIEYSTALFKQATIEELAACYKEVLEQVVKNKKIKLKEIIIHHDIMKECSNKLQDQELAFDF